MLHVGAGEKGCKMNAIKWSMKVLGIMYHKNYFKIPVCLHHRLSLKTAAGLRHGVPVEVAHHLLDQGGDSVVMGNNTDM
jgi:hypothetical protein